MKCLKLIALDVDGVALNDTFSPIMYSVVKSWGGEYTPEVERNIFSQKRADATAFLNKHFNLNLSDPEILAIYFSEREKYLKKKPAKPAPGLRKFLEICRDLNLKIVSYGGLDKNHFIRELNEYQDYFDGEKYICTNDFRPGIKEIVKTYYNLEYENVLFIDDVNRVAEEAQKLNVPFIGIPSDFKYGFQKKDMIKTGVKYIFSGLEDIDTNLLKQIDHEASEGRIWSV